MRTQSPTRRTDRFFHRISNVPEAPTAAEQFALRTSRRGERPTAARATPRHCERVSQEGNRPDELNLDPRRQRIQPSLGRLRRRQLRCNRSLRHRGRSKGRVRLVSPLLRGLAHPARGRGLSGVQHRNSGWQVPEEVREHLGQDKAELHGLPSWNFRGGRTCTPQSPSFAKP
jgi:hypothetical protein